MKQTNQQHFKKNTSLSLIFSFLIFMISLVAFTSFLSMVHKTSFSSIFIDFRNSLYFPHYNIFTVNNLWGINALKLYYIFLLSTIFLGFTALKILSFLNLKPLDFPPTQILINIVFVCLFFYIGIQQSSRINYYLKEQSLFGGKTISEKEKIIFGGIYTFSEACKKILTKNYKGILISDIDTNKDPWMAMQRALSYHLFPKVSLNYLKPRENTCLILFYKNDPFESIPDGYEILLSTDDKKLILAVKEKDLK